MVRYPNGVRRMVGESGGRMGEERVPVKFGRLRGSPPRVLVVGGGLGVVRVQVCYDGSWRTSVVELVHRTAS
jgi:hypothetical protein